MLTKHLLQPELLIGKKETHNFVYDLMKLGIVVNLNLKRIENTNKQI